MANDHESQGAPLKMDEGCLGTKEMFLLLIRYFRLASFLAQVACVRAHKDPSGVRFSRPGLNENMHPAQAPISALEYFWTLDASGNSRSSLDSLLCIFLRNGIDDINSKDAYWIVRSIWEIAEIIGKPYESTEDMLQCAIAASPFSKQLNIDKIDYKGGLFSWIKNIFKNKGHPVVSQSPSYALTSGLLFRGLSDEGLLRIERALRESPTVKDQGSGDDSKHLDGIQFVLKSRKLSPL